MPRWTGARLRPARRGAGEPLPQRKFTSDVSGEVWGVPQHAPLLSGTYACVSTLVCVHV